MIGFLDAVQVIVVAAIGLATIGAIVVVGWAMIADDPGPEYDDVKSDR